MTNNQKAVGAVVGSYLGAVGYVITTKGVTPERVFVNAGVGAITGVAISKKSISTVVGVGTGIGLYLLLTPKNKQNRRDLFVSALVGGVTGFATAYVAEQAS